MVVMTGVTGLVVAYPRKVIVRTPNGEILGWIQRVNTDTGEVVALCPDRVAMNYSNNIARFDSKVRARQYEDGLTEITFTLPGVTVELQ